MALSHVNSRTRDSALPSGLTRWTLRTACTALVALVALASATGTADAQAVTGAGDDAIPVSKGTVRIRIAGQWNDWDAVYADSAGGSGKRPLRSLVAQRALGALSLPRLQPAEAAIRELTGQSNFSLSLGTLEASGDVRQSTAPISVDVGITRRLSIGVLIPYVESRDNTLLVLNREGTGANVGANPAFGRTGGAAARASNGALLREIAAARVALQAEITRCQVATASNCDAIRSNPAAAQQLLSIASATQTAVATLYGDSLRAGSPLVPLASTTLGSSINGSITALRSLFEGYGVRSIGETSRPVGATTAYGPGSLDSLAADSALGLGYSRLGNTRRAGIGDIDLTGSFLLYDTFGGSQARRLNNRGRALRSLLTVGWRFGTAGADDATNAFDVPIGDGANALLLRSTTDLVLSRRFWLSASLRVVKPFADDRVVAIPLRTDSTFLSAFTLGRARQSLGQRTELEVAPRLAFGDFFGVSAAYMIRRVGESTLDATGTPSPSSVPMLLESTAPASTFQAASIGVSFSTLASYVRGRSRLPVEVMYTHTLPVTGSGGIVPAVSVDRLELRIYTAFPRR